MVRVAVTSKKNDSLERCGTIQRIRTEYPVNDGNKYILIHVNLTVNDKPSHWVLLTLERGGWKVYDSIGRYNAGYNAQYSAMVKPLTVVLNQMGHKDLDTGEEINTSIKYPAVPKQENYPDCALHTCLYLKTLLKHGHCLGLSQIPDLLEKLHRKRIKLAVRILSEPGAWKLEEQQKQQDQQLTPIYLMTDFEDQQKQQEQNQSPIIVLTESAEQQLQQVEQQQLQLVDQQLQQ